MCLVARNPRTPNYRLLGSHFFAKTQSSAKASATKLEASACALPRLDFTLSGGAIETFGGSFCCIPMGLLARGWARILCSVLADQLFGSHT